MDQQHHGKTAISIELAKRINGEIISADSMQIYKDMNIGTAKITKEEMQGIRHYMIDFVSPSERYSVSSYKKEAEKCIEEILEQGKIPIICGGTGLYIDSLIYGIEFIEEKADETYRNKLNEIAKTEGLKNKNNNVSENCLSVFNHFKSNSINDFYIPHIISNRELKAEPYKYEPQK